MRGRVLAACIALACGAALAQESRPHPWELRVDGGGDRLSRGLDDWRELAAQVSYRPSAREATLAGYRATERFGQRDGEAFGGAYVPIPGAAAIMHFEATLSSTHRVLPRHAYSVEIAQPLARGWVVSAGGKSSRYASADVKAAWIVVEKYLGDFRVAYQAQVSRPEGASWAPGHRLTGSWYRGDLTFVTLVGARGREVENLFPLGLLQSDVRSASIAAGLEMTPRLGLVLDLGWTRQGDLYTRRGARLGTRFLF